MTDLDRVMAAIMAEPGISNAGLSEELGLAPDTLKELTMQLRAQRQAAFRSLPDEDGDIIVGWYPVPYEPAARKVPEDSAAPEQDDGRAPCPVSGCDTRLLRGGHACRTHISNVHGELPVRERSDLYHSWEEKYKDEPQRAAPEDGFKCAHCSRTFRNRGILTMHERVCKGRLEATEDGPSNDVPEPAPEPASQPLPALADNQCPECAAAGRVHVAKSPAGLSMHRAKAHGVMSTDRKAAEKRRRVAVEASGQNIPAPKRSADDVRSCPVAGCASEFKGLHSRKSLINHMVRLHDIELSSAKLIADGGASPPDMGKPSEEVSKKPITVPITDPAVDADIIPPSEIECEGCDQLHDGECAQGEECVCNCATKMEQLEAELPDCGDACRIGPLPPAEEFISDVRGAIDKCGGSLPWWDSCPGPRVLRFPDRAEYEEYLTRPPLPWGDLTVEQAYLDAFERKVRDDLPEPTALEQMCAMAREIEEIARRRGFKCGVHLTCGDGITADGLFVSIKPEAGA